MLERFHVPENEEVRVKPENLKKTSEKILLNAE
jgi:hypothetical protein